MAASVLEGIGRFHATTIRERAVATRSIFVSDRPPAVPEIHVQGPPRPSSAAMKLPYLAMTMKATVLLFAASATAFARHHAGMLVGPVEDTMLIAQNSTHGWGTFDQLIDHANPKLGTFK